MTTAQPLLVVRQQADPMVIKMLSFALWGGVIFFVILGIFAPGGFAPLRWAMLLVALVEVVLALFLPGYLKEALERIQVHFFPTYVMARLPMGRTSQILYTDILAVRMSQTQRQYDHNQATVLFEMPYAPIRQNPIMGIRLANVNLEQTPIEIIQDMVVRGQNGTLA